MGVPFHPSCLPFPSPPPCLPSPYYHIVYPFLLTIPACSFLLTLTACPFFLAFFCLPILPEPSCMPIPPHFTCLPIPPYPSAYPFFLALPTCPFLLTSTACLFFIIVLACIVCTCLPFLLAYPSPPFLLACSSSPSCLPIPLLPLLPFTEENPPGPRRADEKPLPLTCKSDSSWHHFSPGAADMATRGDGRRMNKHTHFANDLSFCWVWECLRRAFVETRCLVLMHQKDLGISGVLILMCLFVYLFIGFWAFSFWPVCVPFCLP